MVVKQSISAVRIAELAVYYENRRAEDVIEWAIRTHGSRMAVCTGLQVEGMAVLDMAHRIDSRVRVVTIDTGRLPRETYDLIDTIRSKYDIDVEVYCPDETELEPMVKEHGVNPFYRSVELRMACCNIRKVQPLNRALRGFDAWATGLRRSQTQTRLNVQKVELDTGHDGIVKVNPLADWSSQQVWDLVKANDVPYNRLYDQGYASIGCAPCTRPVQPGEDPRAGRWWWEDNVAKECGIHFSPNGVASRDVRRNDPGYRGTGPGQPAS